MGGRVSRPCWDLFQVRQFVADAAREGARERAVKKKAQSDETELSVREAWRVKRECGRERRREITHGRTTRYKLGAIPTSRESSKTDSRDANRDQVLSLPLSVSSVTTTREREPQ